MGEEFDRGGHRPARGYTRLPFEAENTAAMRHGARSERAIAPVAAVADAALMAAAPWLAAPEYAGARAALARTEARIHLVHAWLEANGVLDAKGKPRPAADLVVKLERQAMEQRDRLGLSPLARARLGRDLAGTQVDLARLLEGASQAPVPTSADLVSPQPELVPEVGNSTEKPVGTDGRRDGVR